MWILLKNIIYSLVLMSGTSHLNCWINAYCVDDDTGLDLSNSSFITRMFHTSQEPSHNVIENLNEYLKPFGEGDCLIHLINHRGIDFFQLEFPVVLSRYTIVQTMEECADYYRPVLYEKSKYLKKGSEVNEDLYVKGIDRSANTRWTCLATFDIHPPNEMYEFLEEFNPFWRKRKNEKLALLRKDDRFVDVSIYFPKAKATTTSYPIILWNSGNDKLNPGLWEKMKKEPTNDRGNAMMQTPKNNLILLKTKMINGTISRVENMSLVCYYCNKMQLEEVPLSKSLVSTVSRQVIDEKFKTFNKVNNGVPVYLNFKKPYADFGYQHCKVPSNTGAKMFEEINSKLFSDIPQLRMIQLRPSQLENPAESEELIDREISRILFGNLSFTLRKYFPECYKCFNYIKSKNMENTYWDLWTKPVAECDHSNCISKFDQTYHFPSFGPSVRFRCKDLNNHLAFIRTRDEYTFITCGQPKIDGINFTGFIAAFDNPVWIFTLVTFWVASIFAIISSERNLTNSKCNFLVCIIKSFFLGLRSLLEQGDDLLANGKQKTAIRWIVGSWILMAVIIVNAYKGENITSLTAPRAPIPITNFSQLLEYEFKIYSKLLILQFDYPGGGGSVNLKTNDFEQAVNLFWWQIDKNGERAKVLKHLIQNVTKAVRNPVDELRKCEDSATTDWTEELEVLSRDLKQVSNESNRLVFVGKEKISYKIEGWLMEKWVNPNIPIRTDALVFSGIIQRWEELRKISRKLGLNGSASVIATPQDTPTKLTGNVATIFVIFGICVAFCLLSFFFEIVFSFICNASLLCLVLLYFKVQNSFSKIKISTSLGLR